MFLSRSRDHPGGPNSKAPVSHTHTMAFTQGRMYEIAIDATLAFQLFLKRMEFVDKLCRDCCLQLSMTVNIHSINLQLKFGNNDARFQHIVEDVKSFC